MKKAVEKSTKNGFVFAEFLLLCVLFYRWIMTGKVVYDALIVFFFSLVVYFTSLLYYENYKR